MIFFYNICIKELKAYFKILNIMNSKITLLTCLLALVLYGTSADAQCLSGNCRDGYGKFKYESGDLYIGQFEAHKSHGQGLCVYTSGIKYVGTWKGGKIEGEGRMYLQDGSIKAGIWKNNKFLKEATAGCLSGDCENGYGIYLYEDGVKYIGVFKSGAPSTQGTVYYTDGSKYVGKWSSQKRNGEGTFFTTDGLIKEGAWQNDNFIGATKSAKGCVEGNCQNGDGIYVYRDNTRYEGAFVNSVAHGKGICYYSDGDMYVGEWSNHNFDGFGTMYISDGTVLEGHWRAGEYVGKAKAQDEAVAKTNPTALGKPKVYALLVGVARYNHMKSLRYTDDDAYRMYAFLKSPEGGALADEQVKVLIDEDATKDNILKSMREIFKKASPNDMVFFYFSGHGLKGSFLPIDYDGVNNKLMHTDITNILSECKAKFKVCIADACHSGSVEESLYSHKSPQNLIESYYDAFRASSGGTALMMSSKAEETSIENNGLRQGIFSHFLIRGLKGGADNDNNSVVTVNELFEYVKANVRYYTNNYQTPVIYGEYDDSMPLGVVR